MAEFFTFAKDSPFLTFFAFWILAEVTFKIVNRLLRSINIALHGWPPEHLDADGDWRPTEEET